MPTAFLPRFSLRTWIVVCVALALNSMVWASAATGQIWAVCVSLGEASLVLVWTAMVLLFGAAYTLAAFADLFRRKKQIISPFATSNQPSPRQIEPPVDFQ
jgi:hypothetical protein